MSDRRPPDVCRAEALPASHPGPCRGGGRIAFTIAPRRLQLPAILLGMLVAVGAAEPRIIDLAVRAGALAPGQRLVRVQQGDDVTLRWTTDGPLTLHLHGYDIQAKPRPGAPAEMTFRARAAGRFPITVHGAGKDHERTLGYLEVHPR